MVNGPPVGGFISETPYTVEAGAEVLEARKLMLRHKVRHLPVVSGETLVGLISDRDIKLMLGPEFDYPNPHEVSVSDVMVEEPYTVDVETPLVRVLRHMAEAHIGAALVTREGRLAGLFTAMDACRCLAERLEADTGPGDPAA